MTEANTEKHQTFTWKTVTQKNKNQTNMKENTTEPPQKKIKQFQNPVLERDLGVGTKKKKKDTLHREPSMTRLR